MLVYLKQPTIDRIIALSGNSQDVEKFVRSLSRNELVELQALVWQGRDSFIDWRIPFAEQLICSQKNVEGMVRYIVEKHSCLSSYLRHGMALLTAEREGVLMEYPRRE